MGGLEFSLIMATIRLINGGVFDSAGFCGTPGALRTALVELPPSRIAFATDYPQEIRTPGAVREFVDDVRRLGTAGEQIRLPPSACPGGQGRQRCRDLSPVTSPR